MEPISIKIAIRCFIKTLVNCLVSKGNIGFPYLLENLEMEEYFPVREYTKYWRSSGILDNFINIFLWFEF